MCLATHLLEEEHAEGTAILVINSGSFWRKITESGKDLNLLFPLRHVLLSDSISSSHSRIGGRCHPSMAFSIVTAGKGEAVVLFEPCRY
jgi:hypothetical protein